MSTLHIKPYTAEIHGVTVERAEITVWPDEGQEEPGLSFQVPGTALLDEEGRRWDILSSLKIQHRDEHGAGYEPPRYHFYSFEYLAQRHNER